jgi:hypothetical protein
VTNRPNLLAGTKGYGRAIAKAFSLNPNASFVSAANAGLGNDVGRTQSWKKEQDCDYKMLQKSLLRRLKREINGKPETLTEGVF